MIKATVNSKSKIKLIANLLGWHLHNEEIMPPHNVQDLIIENNNSIVNMVISDEGVIFEIPDTGLSGLWSEDVFSIYDKSGNLSVHEVVASDVETGIAFMCGIRWLMQKMSASDFGQIDKIISRANRITADDIRAIVDGNDDDGDEKENYMG